METWTKHGLILKVLSDAIFSDVLDYTAIRKIIHTELKTNLRQHERLYIQNLRATEKAIFQIIFIHTELETNLSQYDRLYIQTSRVT